jgi:hypothetical protein
VGFVLVLVLVLVLVIVVLGGIERLNIAGLPEPATALY